VAAPKSTATTNIEHASPQIFAPPSAPTPCTWNANQSLFGKKKKKNEKKKKKNEKKKKKKKKKKKFSSNARTSELFHFRMCRHNRLAT
jgi:hypothetical protein